MDNGGRQVDDGIDDHRETETKGQTITDNVKHGIFLDLVELGSVTEGPVMESMHVPISVTTTVGSESALVSVPVCVELKLVEANLKMSHSMHVVTAPHAGDGLTEIKTKPTWTRVARMDCGLKNTTCAATKPTLGKRTLLCEADGAILGTESKEMKISRTQNEAQKNEMARVLEHPNQTQ